MLFLDKKGRLFGKINIIDFIVILILVSLIPSGVMATKIMLNLKVPMDEPGPRQLTVRWEIPSEILEFTKEVKEFEKIEPAKKIIRNLDYSYKFIDTIEYYWGYSIEMGTESNRAGQVIESRKPLAIRGLIMRVDKL